MLQTAAPKTAQKPSSKCVEQDETIALAKDCAFARLPATRVYSPCANCGWLRFMPKNKIAHPDSLLLRQRTHGGRADAGGSAARRCGKVCVRMPCLPRVPRFRARRRGFPERAILQPALRQGPQTRAGRSAAARAAPARPDSRCARRSARSFPGRPRSRPQP